MGAGRKLSLAEHTARERKKAAERGSRGQWAGKLKNWHHKDTITKTASGERIATINVLLSTKADIVELAIHSFPKMIEMREGEDKGKTKVFNTDFNCFEDLSVIEQQFHFDDKGERVAPPQVCPICRFLDWLRVEIESERVDWGDIAFQFKGSKGSIKLNTGGVCGLYRELDDDQKAYLSDDKNINLKEAFKQSATARGKFIYCVVDLGDLDKGLQATSESKSIGQQMTAVIDERKHKLGPKGDPTENPYPFTWDYFPSKQGSDMYKASALGWSDLEDAGFTKKEEAIRLAQGDKIPAVFEQLRKYPNVKQLRAQMEAACKIDDVPWDDIFGPVEELADDKGWVNDDEDKAREKSAEDFPHGANADGPGEDPGNLDDGDDDLDCGACGKPVKATDPKCPHCGEVFEEEGAADGADCVAEDRFKRNEDGNINNCSLANGDEAKNCQLCKGKCPDAEKFKPPETPKALASPKGGKGGKKPGSGPSKRGSKPSKSKGEKEKRPPDAGEGDDALAWEGEG